jgi:hypothetical protein
MTTSWGSVAATKSFDHILNELAITLLTAVAIGDRRAGSGASSALVDYIKSDLRLYIINGVVLDDWHPEFE